MSFRNELTFGLDLGDKSLKALQFFTRRKKFHLGGVGETPIEPGIIENGAIKDGVKLAAAIREVMHSSGIAARNVIAALPETKTFLKFIAIQKGGAAALNARVTQLLEQHIPARLDEIWWDYTVIQDDTLKTNILVAAALKETVASYTAALKRAGLTPIGLDIETLACGRALVGAEHKGQSLLIADLGASTATLLAAAQMSIYFTATGGVSSDGLTGQLAAALNIAPEKAEEIKQQNGIGEGAPEQYRTVMREYLTQLCNAISRAMQYAHEGFPALPAISSILLTGGGALLKGLPEYLTNALKIKTLIGNPWVNTKDHLEVRIPASRAPRFATASGLALAGLRQDQLWPK